MDITRYISDVDIILCEDECSYMTHNLEESWQAVGLGRHISTVCKDALFAYLTPFRDLGYWVSSSEDI